MTIMRFHLVDRIESWEPMRRITARKATSVYEDYWQPSRGGPVMPFGLALEALCQAGAWLVLLSTEHRKRAALLNIGEVTVQRDAMPGDVLRMSAEVVSVGTRIASVDGWVDVDRQRILTVRGLMCGLIDADQLDDPLETARMARVLLGHGPLD
ncbi:3-hydroxyacyl-ACP dehydratase FabZ family protein [Nocardia amamiensis]|uniref:3-hydroxyacyl-ACP dehydratase FabZ family protein n=1 Tax=Nocardia TaxID=1817 RepID=UPI0033F356A8